MSRGDWLFIVLCILVFLFILWNGAGGMWGVP